MSHVIFERDEYGFWRQINPSPIDYDKSYDPQRKTTQSMAELRIGVIARNLGEDKLKDMTFCDVGAGGVILRDHAAKTFGRACAYDVYDGPFISREELYSTEWDVVMLADVIEHLEDIETLFTIPWKAVYISIPETPLVDDWRELESWRHFKPDEHLWNLNGEGLCRWLEDHGCEVLEMCHDEDAIRLPWSPEIPNITTIVARRGAE